MDSKITDGLIEGIAIIGMAGRFPGASNIDQFWENLSDGVESISVASDDELKSSGVNPALLNDPLYVKAKGSLVDIEMFDASFFGFTPREAEITDPQQRLFLECAWEAIEDAGFDVDRYEGKIGVYAGVSLPTYLLLNLFSNPDLVASMGAIRIVTQNGPDHLTTRVSYKLNLRGPGVTIQTACSTSLVAIHMACQSLWTYQCDMALAGSSAVTVPKRSGYLYQEGGIASPDGHCRAFDANAKGTVFGNGVGVVALKRLSDALADRDHIYAVIKSSAINNDGSLKVGYTAPSLHGQAEVISSAQALAGVSADSISYIEAHGTATPLGDPIEIAALTQAFRLSTVRNGFCAIGSVKTNIGHTNAAAGVAGLIKTALSLKHKLIPASLHFHSPNPEIDFSSSPFYVNTELRQWDSPHYPRRAGVSSFGIGGTNAHVVLEEAPQQEESSASRSVQMLMLSARTERGVEEASIRLLEHLKKGEEDLADVAYTLQVGRKEMEHRKVVVAASREEAIEAIERRDPRRVIRGFGAARERRVAMMFPGQGAQYVGMGRGLYEEEATFRRTVEEGAEIVKEETGIDLLEVIYPVEGREEEARELLNRTEITQPALYVIEYGLGKMMEEWGIRPEVMIGHSIGEYAFSTLEMRPFDQIPLDEWERVLRVNVTGAFLCARAVAPAMRTARWGRIVNIGSGAVSLGRPNYLHYVASKAALVGMSNSLARELGAHGITVNAVLPGATFTEVPRKTVTPEQKKAIVGMQCIPRPEVPEDLVGAVVFLASPAAGFVTGQALTVDGGATHRG